MRTVNQRTARTIADGGFNTAWVFDLMYDGDRRLANVGIENGPSLAWDGGQFVTASGNARVVWSDDHATSLIPRQVGDWFSPFGAEMQVDCLIGGGVFTERIPMSRLVVTDVPNATEARMLWEGRLIHPGEAFTVTLKDRLAKIQRDDFPFPTAPQSTSAWGEIQSITGMPVIRNTPDATLPTIAYEGSREDALKALFDVLDAWPHMESSGALTSRPKTWSVPVGELVNVTAAPPSMTSEYTYNRVVVVGKSPDGDPLYGVRSVNDGFLRAQNPDGTQSPFGGSTYRYSDNLGVLDTQAKVDAYANELLPRVARIRSVTREVSEMFNPLREVGDVLTFRDGRRYGPAPVRVQRVSHAGAITNLTVEVPDA
jgi:hypothetical protein